MAENTTVIIALIGVVGSLAGGIVAANIAFTIYTRTVKLVEVANALLANSFTSLQTSAGVLASGIGIAALTLQAFYELFREGPEAIRQTIQPFKDFARFTVATVATIGNGILSAVELVSRGINSMVNDAINAINFLNPTSFGEIPNVPMPDFPKIPVPSFGGGSYYSPAPAAVGSGAAREGGVGQILAGTADMPAMPSPVAPLPSVGGGGSGASATDFGDQSGRGGGYFGDSNQAMASAIYNIYVSGVMSNAQTGEEIVNNIRAYNRAAGPANIAVA
jgi:hypothetical protein